MGRGLLNRQLKGWGNYFKFGYPRDAFREINRHVGQRQRAFRLPEGTIRITGISGDLGSSPWNSMREPMTKVFRRAGCGKSVSPSYSTG
jgi:hypothetical protein